MNNNTKKANVMTWAKFKNKFNPVIYSTTDLIGGKQIVQPTMRNVGFKEDTIYDIDENKKPLQVLSEKYDFMKYTWIVYYKWKYRDGSGFAISVYYS